MTLLIVSLTSGKGTACAARPRKAEPLRLTTRRVLECRGQLDAAELRKAPCSVLSGRRHVACLSAAGGGVAPAVQDGAPNAGAWASAQQMFENGEVFEGAVRATNGGGVVVDCWGVNGFIPNSLITLGVKPEVGQRVRAMFVEVDQLRSRLILSQKQIALAALVKQLEVGQVVEGKVKWLEDYGAFVELQLPGGNSVTGLIHRSELSWGHVRTPEACVTVGEVVKCKVLSTESSTGKVGLSLRALKPDPLKQTVETMFESESEVDWVEASVPLPGLDDVVRELKVEEGVVDVRLGRQATLKGVVSQEMELWLTKEEVDGHFNVIARGGSTIQEVMVYCSLDKDALKSAIDRVLRRV